MNKLKKWVFFPISVFVVAIALLVLLIVLSVQVGFLWSLVIVFVPVIASVVALKKAGGKSYLREKTFLRLIIPVDEVSDPSTVKIQEIVGVAILVVFAGWLMVSTFSDSVEISKTTAPEKTDSATDLEIVVEAEEIVKKSLKSPSTAKFPGYREVIIKRFMNKAPNRAPNEAYEVSSYVDSQNSFGAMIRSTWTVVFEYVGTMMKVHKVVISGEVVYDDSTE